MITLTLNGREVTSDVSPDTTLFDFCRTHGLKSVKCGCETSNCGLCTVWLDGKPVLSCSVMMGRVDGHEVTTLEALQAESAEFARCMAEEGAEQCGFCSPGLVMAVLALDRDFPDADEQTIRRELSNNLCRCSGYAGQMRAIRRFLARRHNADGRVADVVDSTVENARSIAERGGQVDGAERGETLSRPVVKKDAASLLAGKPVYAGDLAPDGPRWTTPRGSRAPRTGVRPRPSGTGGAGPRSGTVPATRHARGASARRTSIGCVPFSPGSPVGPSARSDPFCHTRVVPFSRAHFDGTPAHAGAVPGRQRVRALR